MWEVKVVIESWEIRNGERIEVWGVSPIDYIPITKNFDTRKIVGFANTGDIKKVGWKIILDTNISIWKELEWKEIWVWVIVKKIREDEWIKVIKECELIEISIY